jgi:hypothetical protein
VTNGERDRRDKIVGYGLMPAVVFCAVLLRFLIGPTGSIVGPVAGSR